MRVTRHAPAESVGAALDLVPVRIRELLHFDLFTERPVFAGLHTYAQTDDLRSYEDTAHCVYPFHQRYPREAKTTVVMRDGSLWTAVHEIGHVLDERLAFDFTPEPVTLYAATDRYEAFAESFTRWVVGPAYTPWMPDQREVDPAGVAFFGGLCQ